MQWVAESIEIEVAQYEQVLILVVSPIRPGTYPVGNGSDLWHAVFGSAPPDDVQGGQDELTSPRAKLTAYGLRANCLADWSTVSGRTSSPTSPEG